MTAEVAWRLRNLRRAITLNRGRQLFYRYNDGWWPHRRAYALTARLEFIRRCLHVYADTWPIAPRQHWTDMTDRMLLRRSKRTRCGDLSHVDYDEELIRQDFEELVRLDEEPDDEWTGVQ